MWGEILSWLMYFISFVGMGMFFIGLWHIATHWEEFKKKLQKKKWGQS